MSFEQQVKEIGFEETVNCMLVASGARTAFLLQYADYNEFSANDSISKGKLSAIRKYYPHFKFTPDEQGMLISVRTLPKTNTSAAIGRVLNYPCADVFANLNRDKTTYDYTIYVICKIKGNIIKSDLMSNLCPTIKYKSEFEKLANSFEVALRMNPLIKPYFVGIEVKERVNVSELSVLNKVLNNEKLNSDDFRKIDEILYNYGYSDDFTPDSFNLANPLHRGILIGIIANYKYNPQEVFYPITNTNTLNSMNSIMMKQEKVLLDILSKRK